jgi:TPP-dependent pyruvate/acetoin dehydrogenase alpha subunit
MTMHKEQYLELYKSLVRIRRAEEVIADEYRKGVMRTPTHFGIGQEGVAVGICSALNLSDVVFTHHRSHTHYLAKGGDLFRLIAELLGREGGCSRGRGGSVHIVDRSVGFLGSSPILGHSLALATGSALAFQMNASKNIAVGFFGEGACDEGAVWESLNYAATRKLPVLFVCENNLYATESPMAVRQPVGTSLCERARSFKIEAVQLDGNNVAEVYAAAQKAIDHCRSGNGPMFLECMTYRWLEHVGPLWDYEAKREYRSRDELERWMLKCPVKKAHSELVAQGIATDSELDRLLHQINQDIQLALEQAHDSPWPEVTTLFDNAF